MKFIIGIDPGSIKSAYIVIGLDHENKFYIFDKDHAENNDVRKAIIRNCATRTNIVVAIETIVSYGNAMGQTTIDTAKWVGRFSQFTEDMGYKAFEITRPNIKLNLCNSRSAKDKNVNQRLKDRFGDFGTKKNQGRLYKLKDGLVKGGRSHVMSALAVAISYADINIGEII